MTENNKIIEAILQEAVSQSDSIKVKASTENSIRLDNARKEAEDIKNQKINIALREANEIIENNKTITRLDINKIVLGGKRAVIDKVYQSVIEKLNKLSKTDYTKLVCKLIKANYEKGDKVVVSKNANVDSKKLLSCEFITSNNIEITFDGDFSSGLKLVGNGFEKVLTFECIVEELRTSTEMEVNKELFNNEK